MRGGRISRSCSSVPIFNVTTRRTKPRPIVTEELQVADAVLQKTGFRGDEEVEEHGVVEGDGAEKDDEMTVGVTAPKANRNRGTQAVKINHIQRLLNIADMFQMLSNTNAEISGCG